MGVFDKVLYILIACQQWRTIPEISQSAGLAESTVEQIIVFLAKFDMLTRSLPTGKYRLSEDLSDFFEEIGELDPENA